MMMMVRALVVATILAPSVLTANGEGSNVDDEVHNYDDSRRLGCMQAIGELGKQHPEINKASEFLLDAMDMQFLEMTTNRTVTQIAYPSVSDNTKMAGFQQACESAGGYFGVFTGVLDCVGYGEYKKGRASVTIQINSAQCFTLGEECRAYRESPEDWQLEMKQVMKEDCTLWDAAIKDGDIDYNVIFPSLSTASMPPGEPKFVDNSASYTDNRRSTCMDAFKAFFDKFPDLEDAGLMEFGRMKTDLLQISPILTNRERYQKKDTDGPEESQEHHKKLCEESGGTFDVFTGTLDCVGYGSKNKGVKTTIVEENAANCFPATGCSGYTLAQWKIDTAFHGAQQSCIVRSVDTPDDPNQDDAGSETIQQVNGNELDNGKESKGMAVPLTILGVVLVLIVVVLMARGRNRKVREIASDDNLPSSLEMGESYKDYPGTHDDNEAATPLPSID